jgi:hypothetical protein
VYHIFDSMERDHTGEADADVKFVVGNYGTTTTSRIEWLFVTDPVFGLDRLREQKIRAPAPELIGADYLSAWPGTSGFFAEADRAAGSKTSADSGHRHTRDAKSWNDFKVPRERLNQLLAAINEQPISEPEFFGLRLYTGPLLYAASPAPLPSPPC